jgi:chromosome segregation ATPase
VQEVGESGASTATGAMVGKFKSRIRVLETQLAAYKSDAARTERERSRLQDALSRAEAQNRRKGGGAGSKSSAPSPGSGDGESGGAHANWAAQKRLRQRADTLAKRLREKTEELEVSRKQCENAKTQLARALKDKAGLASQINKGGAGGGSGGSSGDKAGRASSSNLSSALSQLTSVEESRKRVYELEQRCADLTRTIEVEKEGEIRTLRAERDGLADKKEAVERQLASSKRRVRALEQTVKSGSGGGGGGKTSDRESGAMYLRSSEERFREGEELKGELDTVTAERNVLEGRLLERDNLIMELRFDVEAATVGMPMLERRVRELETSNRALASQVIDGSRGGGRGSPLSASQSRKAGERFKRERDLEGVIESQNRVIMKMQTENERLTKRGVSASKIVEAQKELRSLRRRVKDLSSEREELLDKAATASAARLDSGKQKDMVRQLRRKMKSTESKMSSLRETARDAQASKQRLEDELAQANTQLTKVERDVERLTTGSSARGGAGGRSERELRRVADENDALRSELEEMRGKLTQTQRDLRLRESERGTPGSTGGASKSSGSSREAELMDENKKLRAELESFDLEFFEEVEDLKYKYSQTREENQRLKDRIRELGGGR